MSRDTGEATPSVRPVYAVLATETGGGPGVQQLATRPAATPRYSPEETARRKKQVGQTMRCPHCDEPLTRFKVPDVPFCEWDAEYLWICNAAHCPFTNRSLDVMGWQGSRGVAYRLMYQRERDRCYTVPDVGLGDSG